MTVDGKVWGSTRVAISTPFFESHELKIKPNMQCSLHVHHHKWNAFRCVSGRLFIDVVKNSYPLTDVTELGPGDWHRVRPGEYHRFRTGDEPCEAIEVYYPEMLSDDIERKDHGGPVLNQVRKGVRRQPLPSGRRA